MIRCCASIVPLTLLVTPSIASAQAADTHEPRAEPAAIALAPAPSPPRAAVPEQPGRVAPILLGALSSTLLGAAGGYAGLVLAYGMSSTWNSTGWRAGWAIVGGLSALSAGVGVLAIDALFGFRGQGWSPLVGSAVAFSTIMTSAAIEYSHRGYVLTETLIVGLIANPLFSVVANELWVLLRPDHRARSPRAVAMLPMVHALPGGLSLSIGARW